MLSPRVARDPASGKENIESERVLWRVYSSSGATFSEIMSLLNSVSGLTYSCTDSSFTEVCLCVLQLSPCVAISSHSMSPSDVRYKTGFWAKRHRERAGLLVTNLHETLRADMVMWQKRQFDLMLLKPTSCLQTQRPLDSLVWSVWGDDDAGRGTRAIHRVVVLSPNVASRPAHQDDDHPPHFFDRCAFCLDGIAREKIRRAHQHGAVGVRVHVLQWEEGVGFLDVLQWEEGAFSSAREVHAGSHVSPLRGCANPAIFLTQTDHR